MINQDYVVKAVLYNVVSYEWLTAENGNIYAAVRIRQKGDVLARASQWNMFVDSQETADEIDAIGFPKELWFADIIFPSPEPYVRAWREATGEWAAGDIVCTKDRDGNWEPMLFDNLTVRIRCVNATTPASGENPIKFAERQWRRGINEGTIIPASEYAEDVNPPSSQGGSDPLAKGSSDEEGHADDEPLTPSAQPQNGNGNAGNNRQQFHRSNPQRSR